MRATLLSLLLLSAPALADTTQPRTKAAAKRDVELARRLFMEGVRYYELGQYAEAVNRFDGAYTAAPAPAVLFNLGQACLRAGEFARAATELRAYLAQAPDGPARETAKELLTQAEEAARAHLKPPK